MQHKGNGLVQHMTGPGSPQGRHNKSTVAITIHGEIKDSGEVASVGNIAEWESHSGMKKSVNHAST